MNRFTSQYLNILRVFSAFGVLLVHCRFTFFSADTLLSPYLNFGHMMVIIFFVLSGYVIAFSADTKNENMKQYLIDRFSRLYSVIIPALIFTFIIDSIGRFLYPEYYDLHLNANGNYYIRYLIVFLNLNQIWQWSSLVSTNGTFWSVAYEFWYYIFWGIIMFIPNKLVKTVLILLTALLIGPKIIVLMPCWLVGVAIYYIYKKENTNEKYMHVNIARILFYVSFILMLCLLFSIIEFPFKQYFPNGKPPLFFSSNFLNDYLFSAVVAANIYFSSRSNFNVLSDKIIKPVNFLSNGTFTLYLFHYPLVVFFSIFIPYDHTSLPQVIGVMLLIFFLLTISGDYLERSRFWLKAKIIKVFGY